MKVLRNQKGFTIVEVMVAAVILVIAAVALLGLYSQNFGWIVNAGYVTEAIDGAKTDLDSQISAGTSSTSDSITFSFNGSSPAYIDATHPVTVTGQVIEGTGISTNGTETISVRTFVPTTP